MLLDIVKLFYELFQLVIVSFTVVELPYLNSFSSRSNPSGGFPCKISELIVDLCIDECSQKDSVIILESIGREMNTNA